MTSNDNDGKMSSRSCDVLIIDGGSAGLRAAIEAHDAGSQVLIVSKSRRGDPHTALARGGINAALGTMDPQDNWMIHAADTLSEGLPFPFLLREVFYLCIPVWK
jgi:succinate dehydrogenase / fumarate reductase, flavoprotein subunit